MTSYVRSLSVIACFQKTKLLATYAKSKRPTEIKGKETTIIKAKVPGKLAPEPTFANPKNGPFVYSKQNHMIKIVKAELNDYKATMAQA